MKKITTFFTVVLISVFFFSDSFGQGTIRLTVFDISTIDFAAFAFTNNLSGAPRILQVSIEPAGQQVYVDGVINWKKDEKSSFERLFSFETENFTSKTFFNDEIGTDIQIRNSDANSSLAEENFKRGKPTGTYEIKLVLHAANNAWTSAAEPVYLDFLNPAQTLTILSPQLDSSQDVGSVLIIWDGVQGASSYEVRMNYRENNSVSLEEALGSGNPIINDRNVGNVLSINARDFLDRELLADKEVVVQVTAIVEGPGGGTRLNSNIVNFFTKGAGTTTTTVIADPEMTSLATFLTGYVSNDLIVKLMSGQIKPEDLEFTTGDGKTITYSEFKNILSFLEANRNAISKITFTQK